MRVRSPLPCPRSSTLILVGSVCGQTFAPVRVVCCRWSTGRSLRFEHLHAEAAYHPEALSELRALHPAACAAGARLACEIARAALLAQRSDGASCCELARATVCDPVGLCE